MTEKESEMLEAIAVALRALYNELPLREETPPAFFEGGQALDWVLRDHDALMRREKAARA